MSPELRHLRYFVAVAEERSFTRAAERLHVVQQALSRAVQELERELDVQLLVRTTRKVEVTEAGRELLERGRTALEVVESTWDSAREVAAHGTRELSVAYSQTLERHCVPVLHQAVAERLPGVGVRWYQKWASAVVEGVAAGEHQAGLARYPERLPDLAYVTVAEEPQVLLVGARHPLAERGAVELRALERETLMLFPRDMAPGYHDALLELCRAAGFEPRAALTPDTGAAGLKVGMLERGEVVAVAPLAAARGYVNATAGRVVLVPLAKPVPLLPIHLLWRPQGASEQLRGFVDLVRELGRAGDLVPAAAPSDAVPL